jgi:hypothetical protein
VSGKVLAISEGNAPEKNDFKRLIQQTIAIRTPSEGAVPSSTKAG